MPAIIETFGSVDELRKLLAELPLDAEQRQSVSDNLSSLSESEVHSLTQALTETLSGLEQAVQDIGEMIAASDVQISRDATPGMAFHLSAS